MPEYLKRTGRDLTDDLIVRVPESEKHIARLRGPAVKRLGIDRGNIPNVAAPLEGQMMLQYADQPVGATPVSPEVGSTFLGEHPYYFSNGEWRPFFSANDLNPAMGMYDGGASAITVAAHSAELVPFRLVSGTGVLDLSSNPQPGVLVRGVYSITATVSPDAGWTAGARCAAILTFAVSYAISAWQTKEADSGGVMGLFSVGATLPRDLSDAIWIELRNDDSASHDFTVPYIIATRILEY